MKNAVIKATGVTKQFKDHVVLAGVSLNVFAGEVVGISGTNGSGKSIFLRILCGLLRAEQGDIVVWGQKVGWDVEFPGQTGILIDGPGFIHHLSGFRNLKLLAMIRNEIDDNQIRQTMRTVGLEADNTVPVGKYSTGMRQRLGLAQALMEQPELLILDEPTNGIDRSGTAEIQDLICRLATAGKTIVLTSHSTHELTAVCNRTYELERGELSLI